MRLRTPAILALGILLLYQETRDRELCEEDQELAAMAAGLAAPALMAVLLGRKVSARTA